MRAGVCADDFGCCSLCVGSALHYALEDPQEEQACVHKRVAYATDHAPDHEEGTREIGKQRKKERKKGKEGEEKGEG